MLAAVDGFVLSVNRAAVLDDRSLAPPSTDRATIDRWRSPAREHYSLFIMYIMRLML